MATVTYNCTGCVVIDRAVIDAYNILTATEEYVSSAESDRATAEAARVLAEQGRVQQASDDHGIAQEDHRTAVADHGTAGDDHTTATGDHGTAADDHVIAVADHGTAGDDHLASNAATTRANNAAAAAEHMVDIHQGPPGDDGKSAYEIAVEEGFVGTEEQWLASLQGRDGNPGSSQDYPFELVNNEETNDSTKAHTAAGAKRLKDEIDSLSAVVHNLSGKYYGVFTSSSSLPEGDTPGYAFVGSDAPFAIYNFDGEEWSDTGITVTAITGEPGADGVGFASVESPTPADGTVIITLSNGDTMTLDLNHNHEGYYSKVLGGAQPSGGFLPDVVYSLGTLTGSVTFALASPVTGNVNHYFWMFDTSSTAPTITWPAGITWAAGAAPTIAASKHYEISILGGIAYYSEV